MYLTKKTNLVYIYILYICQFLYINFRTHKRYQKGNVNLYTCYIQKDKEAITKHSLCHGCV